MSKRIACELSVGEGKDITTSTKSLPPSVCWISRLPASLIIVVATFVECILEQVVNESHDTHDVLRWQMINNLQLVNKDWGRVLRNHHTYSIAYRGPEANGRSTTMKRLALPSPLTSRVYHILLEVDNVWPMFQHCIQKQTCIHPHVHTLTLTPILWCHLAELSRFTIKHLRILFPKLEHIRVAFDQHPAENTIYKALFSFKKKGFHGLQKAETKDPVNQVNETSETKRTLTTIVEEEEEDDMPIDVNGQPLVPCTRCPRHCIPYALCQHRYCDVYMSDEYSKVDIELIKACYPKEAHPDKWFELTDRRGRSTGISRIATPICFTCDRTAMRLTQTPLAGDEHEQVMAFIGDYNEDDDENTKYLHQQIRPIVCEDDAEYDANTDTPRLMLPANDDEADDNNTPRVVFLHQDCMRHGQCQYPYCMVRHSVLPFHQCQARKCKKHLCHRHAVRCEAEKECTNWCCNDCIETGMDNISLCRSCKLVELQDEELFTMYGHH